MMGSFLVSICRFTQSLFHIVLFFLILLILLPLQFLLSFFSLFSPVRQNVQRYGYSLLVKSLGIKVKITGDFLTHSPCIYASNHSSYVDILILGSLIPASFISKYEVKSWPLVGYFARLQGTLFIRRTKAHIHSHQKELWDRLQRGGNLILFPEGTTNFGSAVFPFKSALLADLNQKNLQKELLVQPLSICYSHSKGIPLGRKERLSTSWTGTESLLPHFLALLANSPLTVHIHFAPAFPISEMHDRKTATKKIETAVSQGLSMILQGVV